MPFESRPTEAALEQSTSTPSLTPTEDYGPRLQALMRRFASSKRTIGIDFRKEVSWMRMGERLTHHIHPYPAKLIPHIAHFFVANSLLTGHGSWILDPFGGTGTVALEAQISGRNAISVDANPIASLICAAKTSVVDPIALKIAGKRAIKRSRNVRSTKRQVLPDVVNLRHWYLPDVAASLAALKESISEESDEGARLLLTVTFSELSREVSRADPNISVPVSPPTDRPYRRRSRRPPQSAAEVLERFEALLESNCKRLEAFVHGAPTYGSVVSLNGDARFLSHALAVTGRHVTIPKCGEFDLVITSPPYGSAQKYIRATSLNLGWLGLVGSKHLRTLEDVTIGREHFAKSSVLQDHDVGLVSANRVLKRITKVNNVRAHIAATYINEMRQAISEMFLALKPGGHLVMIIGNNCVAGLAFKNHVFLAEISTKLGFTLRLRLVDTIKSRGLMTKRNKTASTISREWVLVLQKPKESAHDESRRSR